MEHLEGITVLNEYMTYTEATWAVIIFASSIAFLLFALFFVIFERPEAALVFLVLTLIVVIVGVICVNCFQIENGMVYECLVDDNITYKELTETYKIIGQRGDIYELKFIE